MSSFFKGHEPELQLLLLPEDFRTWNRNMNQQTVSRNGKILPLFAFFGAFVGGLKNTRKSRNQHLSSVEAEIFVGFWKSFSVSKAHQGPSWHIKALTDRRDALPDLLVAAWQCDTAKPVPTFDSKTCRVLPPVWRRITWWISRRRMSIIGIWPRPRKYVQKLWYFMIVHDIETELRSVRPPVVVLMLEMGLNSKLIWYSIYEGVPKAWSLPTVECCGTCSPSYQNVPLNKFSIVPSCSSESQSTFHREDFYVSSSSPACGGGAPNAPWQLEDQPMSFPRRC